MNDQATRGIPVIPGRIRMAYTLGACQPVLCTLLCDQPLYYMEEEEIFEEEDDSLFLEDQAFATLGAEFAPVQRKINSYEGVAQKFAADADTRLTEFIANAAAFGTPQINENFPGDVIAALGQSRYGQSLLDLAGQNGTDIRASRDVRLSAYDDVANIILVNPDQERGDAVLALVAALRTHARHRGGAGAHPLSYHPDEAILINRACAADLAVAQLRAAWELQLADVNAPWARLDHSQGADLARAFARESLCDFRTLNNGRAAQAAFESWFLSDRCKIEDRELIQAMLIDQETRIYETTNQSLTSAFFAALGETTIGRNYLAALAPTLMADPIFGEVRDRSNANFLWFVKFERSFQQTEHALQGSEEMIHSFDSKQSGPARNKENNAKTITSDWNARSSGETPQPGALEAPRNQSNVVYVSFGR